MAHFVQEKDAQIKLKIETIVKYYAQENKEEYNIVKKAIDVKRKMTRNEFAGLEGSNYTRALFEIPETLSELFIMNLSPEETEWFKSKKGAHWFTRKFKAFALPQYI